jgi:hypothetical protein
VDWNNKTNLKTSMCVTRRGHFNELRSVVIYLARHLKNDTLKQVGEQFGIEKCSTVSSLIEREKHEMHTDKMFTINAVKVHLLSTTSSEWVSSQTEYFLLKFLSKRYFTLKLTMFYANVILPHPINKAINKLTAVYT